MAKDLCASVDAYIAAQPQAAQSALAQVRRAIRGAVPSAEETISYQMPTYKLDGCRLLYFACWKKHYSLYPASKELIAAFRAQLAPYSINRSTLQFPIAEPVPADLIRRIALFRVQEITGRKPPKKSRPAR